MEPVETILEIVRKVCLKQILSVIKLLYTDFSKHCSRGVYFANGVKNIGTPYANFLNSITVAFNMQDRFIEQSIYNIAYLIRIVNPII